MSLLVSPADAGGQHTPESLSFCCCRSGRIFEDQKSGLKNCCVNTGSMDLPVDQEQGAEAILLVLFVFSLPCLLSNLPSDMQLGISCENELCTVIALVPIQMPWLINNGVEMTTGVSKYLFLIILV